MLRTNLSILLYEMCNVVRSGSKAFEFYNSTTLVRGSLTEILAFWFLTPNTVESAYEHTSGICCFHIQGGSEWRVLWSVYVCTLIASETHVICSP